jgi:lysocardiolipin and lysophospholipid acyltransferase
MQLFGYLFLHRDLKRDESHIRRVMRRYLRADYPVKLLLFPEGSDLSPSNVELSHAFSKQRGLPLFDHLLHPRTHGLRICLEEMQAETSRPCYVMDVTVAYTGSIPTEVGLLKGIGPQTVHINCKLIPLAEVPSKDEAALKAWLYQRWVEKEDMLKSFYDDDAVAKLGGPNRTLIQTYLWPMLCLWLLACAACLYSLYAFSAWRFFFVTASVAMFGLTATGGIEQVELTSSNWWHLRSSKRKLT